MQVVQGFYRHYGLPGAYAAIVVGKYETVLVPPGAVRRISWEKQSALDERRSDITEARTTVIIISVKCCLVRKREDSVVERKGA